MKITKKYAIPLLLCLILLVLANIHCLPQPTTPPLAPQPTEPPPQDTMPPETIISIAPDMTINYNEVTFEWTGSDDTSSTASLTYSYYLEGYDTGYVPFSANTTKTYTALPDGTYTFYVKSRDGVGNIDPTPASVEFTIATTPPEEPEVVTPPIVSTLLIVPGSNVNHIAVAYDNTVYAIDSPNAKLYKSDHGGIGWTDISKGLGAGGPWGRLAIAPDNPKVVAVTTNAGAEVYVSTDGGAKFSGTGLSGTLGGGERVTCLAISPGYGRWDIAVGTATGGGNGRVLVNAVSGFPSGWEDMSTGATGWSNADIFAIEYSPGFAADGTLLAIAATAPPTDSTYLYIGLRDLGGNTTIWNSSSGYPVEISQSGQDTPGTPLTYADLALPSDYSGSLPLHRHVYACWSDSPPVATIAGNINGDVYRLDDTVCYRLLVRTDIICSLAHYGMFSRGKLMAGAARASVTAISKGPQTYYTSNPQSTSPTWQNSQKPPTGPGQARVAWSPDGRAAYCGTSTAGIGSHDQSAFSISTNDGFTWNQTGLIDP
ncbi:triple tyrosine motif-containing protein [Chloroflexota bacterium]